MGINCNCYNFVSIYILFYDTDTASTSAVHCFSVSSAEFCMWSSPSGSQWYLSWINNSIWCWAAGAVRGSHVHVARPCSGFHISVYFIWRQKCEGGVLWVFEVLDDVVCSDGPCNIGKAVMCCAVLITLHGEFSCPAQSNSHSRLWRKCWACSQLH